MPVEILRPHRVKRQKIVKDGELERVVAFAGNRVGDDGAILVLLDADDDCPAQLGPALLQRAVAARPDRTVSVVLAKRMFEAWLVAGIESLRGSRTIDKDVQRPDDPEAVNSPKHWIDERMVNPYSEVIDQPALATTVDLAMAATAPSFDKLVRDLRRLLKTSTNIAS